MKPESKPRGIGVALVACGLLVGLLALVGCTQASPNSAQQQLTETNAVVIHAENGDYLFVDTDSDTVYYPLLEEAVLVDEDGRELPLSELAVGDAVVVAGDGAMTMSYPAQYPDISRVTIVSRGNTDVVDSYASIVSTLFPAIDPTSVPAGSLSYRNSSGQITLALNAYSYRGFTAGPDSDELQGSASFANESGIMPEGTPDANLSNPVDATVEFDRSVQSVVLTRYPITVAPEQRVHVDLDAPLENVPATIVGNGEVAFIMDPGYAYSLNATFAEGEASYAFFAAMIAS